jgi:hypothetical protein
VILRKFRCNFFRPFPARCFEKINGKIHNFGSLEKLFKWKEWKSTFNSMILIIKEKYLFNCKVFKNTISEQKSYSKSLRYFQRFARPSIAQKETDWKKDRRWTVPNPIKFFFVRIILQILYNMIRRLY